MYYQNFETVNLISSMYNSISNFKNHNSSMRVDKLKSRTCNVHIFVDKRKHFIYVIKNHVYFNIRRHTCKFSIENWFGMRLPSILMRKIWPYNVLSFGCPVFSHKRGVYVGIPTARSMNNHTCLQCGIFDISRV